jgi:hypothetical protein
VAWIDCVASLGRGGTRRWERPNERRPPCPVACRFRHLADAAHQRRFPAVTIALLAIALFQEDGLLLAVSFVVGILSLLVFGFLVWESAGALGDILGGPLHLVCAKN